MTDLGMQHVLNIRLWDPGEVVCRVSKKDAKTDLGPSLWTAFAYAVERLKPPTDFSLESFFETKAFKTRVASGERPSLPISSVQGCSKDPEFVLIGVRAFWDRDKTD